MESGESDISRYNAANREQNEIILTLGRMITMSAVHAVLPRVDRLSLPTPHVYSRPPPSPGNG
jgi:hypothetical protein